MSLGMAEIVKISFLSDFSNNSLDDPSALIERKKRKVLVEKAIAEKSADLAKKKAKKSNLSVEVSASSSSIIPSSQTQIEQDKIIIDLSDTDDPPINIRKDIPFNVGPNEYVSQMVRQNLQDAMISSSSQIYVRQSFLEQISCSISAKKEQVSSISRDKKLLDEKKTISVARIVKYTEMLNAYRNELTQIITQISDLERKRLFIQDHVNRIEKECHQVSLTKDADVMKLNELEKKESDIVKSLKPEEVEAQCIKDWLERIDEDLEFGRSVSDNLSPLKYAPARKLESMNLELETCKYDITVDFFQLYNTYGFPQPQSDVLFHQLFNFKVPDHATQWKDQVVSFIRNQMINLPMCQNDLRSSGCKDENCQSKHVADDSMEGILILLGFI